MARPAKPLGEPRARPSRIRGGRARRPHGPRSGPEVRGRSRGSRRSCDGGCARRADRRSRRVRLRQRDEQAKSDVSAERHGERRRSRRGSRRSTGSITKGTSRLALAAERAGVKDPPSVAALVVRRWGRPSGAESPGGFPLTCTSLGITSTPRQ